MSKENQNKKEKKDKTHIGVKIMAISILLIFFSCIILAVVLGEMFGLKYMLICLGIGMGVVLLSGIMASVIGQIKTSIWYIKRNEPINSKAIVKECHEIYHDKDYDYVCLLKIISSGMDATAFSNEYYDVGDIVNIYGVLYGKKSLVVSIVEETKKEEESKF